MLDQGNDYDTLPFIVFRTPLQSLNSPEFIEKIIKKALEIDQQIVPADIIKEASVKYDEKPFLTIECPYNEEGNNTRVGLPASSKPEEYYKRSFLTRIF